MKMDAANIIIHIPNPASMCAGAITISSRCSPVLSMTKTDMIVSIIREVLAFSALL